MLSKRRQFKKVLLILLECGMIFLIMELVSEGRIAGEFFSVFRQIQDADSILSDSLGSGRMAIWKATIRELPKYWLFGCGIEKYSAITDFVTKAAFLTFFGYIAQDFVNINVLQVVPYFWPICGLLFLQKKQKRDK